MFQMPRMNNQDECSKIVKHFEQVFHFWQSTSISTVVFENREEVRGKVIVLGSTSWIKGTDAATRWCEENELEYEVILGWPYEKVLEEMAQAKGFVYLPPGGDTCPRMVIEAKLLGCELHINENVQHKDEIWFNTDDPFDTEAYLFAARDRFWNGIKYDMEYKIKLSGYTTTKDLAN